METVNHSVEFVNEEGFHTNKIEGHWRQMKARLPTHGRKKEHYSWYLAEFKWRYIHSVEDLWKEFLKDINLQIGIIKHSCVAWLFSEFVSAHELKHELDSSYINV